jgi:uncharacterized membrane protein YfcA
VDPLRLALVALAALAAGAINAIAGGGSLITFPVLLACGVPPVMASMTNTVALCPGYFGATFAQRTELAGQGGRIVRILPFAIAGSIAGSAILLHTSDRSFETIVPFLLTFAALLLILQPRLKRAFGVHSGRSLLLAGIPIGLAAAYGAYFGAGLGVIILAVLAVVLDDTLVRANALKQLMSLLVNVLAAGIYLVVGRIDWEVAVAIGIGSLVGGVLGGKLVSKIPEGWLRAVAIAVALGVAIVYFIRNFS